MLKVSLQRATKAKGSVSPSEQSVSSLPAGVKCPFHWLPERKSISRVIDVGNANQISVRLPLMFEEVTANDCFFWQHIIGQQAPAAVVGRQGVVSFFHPVAKVPTAMRYLAFCVHEHVHVEAAVDFGQGKQLVHIDDECVDFLAQICA